MRGYSCLRCICGELRARGAQRGEAIAYCMIDLDNFKQINDMYGHSCGDAVLVSLSERIRELLPREARLARLGGDEFALVMAYPVGHTDRVDDLVIRLFASIAAPTASSTLASSKMIKGDLPPSSMVT